MEQRLLRNFVQETGHILMKSVEFDDRLSKSWVVKNLEDLGQNISKNMRLTCKVLIRWSNVANYHYQFMGQLSNRMDHFAQQYGPQVFKGNKISIKKSARKVGTHHCCHVIRFSLQPRRTRYTA